MQDIPKVENSAKDVLKSNLQRRRNERKIIAVEDSDYKWLPRKPLCEVCNKKTAGFFTLCYSDQGAVWKVTCDKCEDPDRYHIEFSRFFKSSHAVIDWFCHINEKAGTVWNVQGLIDKLSELRRAVRLSEGTKPKEDK